jgi:hypothetical protein
MMLGRAMARKGPYEVGDNFVDRAPALFREFMLLQHPAPARAHLET